MASSALLLRSQERVSATGSSELWGLHVRAGGVTLFVGETSAGKTVFLHNFARAMAAGEEFLGIPPPRPLRVLSLDFESFEDVYVDNLAAIGTADGWDFLEIDELERGPALIEHVSGLVTAKGYDIVIVDPLMEAYPVRDENDNAQANVQMLAFRALARSTRAGVVTVHNSGMRRGKGKRAPEKFLGRGATARLDRADVGINFTAEGADVRALHVSKSRSANLNDRIEFRFSGELGYELIESNAPSPAVVATLGREALAVVTKEIGSGNAEVERRTIMEALRVEKGTASEQALDRALRQTVAAGLLRRVRKGAYALAEAATEAMARPDGGDASEAA